jgi:hypothetical protein
VENNSQDVETEWQNSRFDHPQESSNGKYCGIFFQNATRNAAFDIVERNESILAPKVDLFVPPRACLG